jgi:uroporphyrinogen-III synthase
MRLIITRPENDAAVLKGKLERMGHAAILMPLLKIVPRRGVKIPRENYQLICATSANALKFSSTYDDLKKIKILTVGPQSLSVSKTAGFKSCEAHGGDAHGLAVYVSNNFNPLNGPILYLAGAEISTDLQALLQAKNFHVEKVIVYDAIIQAPDGMEHALATADGVLLYSPRSARIWVDLVTTSNLEVLAAAPRYYCLSDNVAKILPRHWQKRVAITPDENAMLALLD